MQNSGDRSQLYTTDSILEWVEDHAPDNLTVYVGSTRYLVPVPALKLLAWNSVPPMIRDENSEEARKNQTLRTGLKALIRPFLPEIIKKSWGAEVKIVPRMNILNWLPRYLIHILINAIAHLEWEVYVEKCDSCQGATYKVTGISPHADGIVRSESLPTTSPDREPLPGGRKPDSSGAAYRDLIGGPVGNSGGPQVWKVNLFERADKQP